MAQTRRRIRTVTVQELPLPSTRSVLQLKADIQRTLRDYPLLTQSGSRSQETRNLEAMIGNNKRSVTPDLFQCFFRIKADITFVLNFDKCRNGRFRPSSYFS